MRLKNVSIKGFKSFADATSLHFGEDVTGIVGPNGSGKSNIVDAIRWVLGEMKNKQLRLEKMNDVIFNGTQKRKRSGAAKVALTFENTKNLIPTEYHTVTVSRHLYQNGDSEYRLNDVVCRRKDIINLFVDTGIGSNSYAIIGQGNIAQVVEGPEGSRRRMIEQAAGISKYKTRKKETENKLAATDADLSRVEDLLFELERNLKDLERQAKRAKKYKEVKAAYKEKSLDLAVVSSEKYRKEYHDLKEVITREKEYITQLRASIHTIEAEVERLKKSHVDLEMTVSSSQRKMNELLDDLRQKESSKEVKSQRLNFLKTDISRLSSQIEEAKKKLDGNNKELIAADEQRQEIQQQREAKVIAAERTQQDYQNLKSQHESARADLGDFLQNKQSLSSSVFNLEKGIAINTNKIEGHLFTTEKMKGQLEDANEDYVNLQNDIKSYKKQKDLLANEIAELSQKLEVRTENIERLQTDLEEVKRLEADVQRDLDKKSNQKDLIQNMVENLEGFPESVKYLNTHWKGDPILLSDIIDCPQEYRPALEAYLEPYLNYFVVQDFQEANKAIQLLSQAQRGKAQFFLVDEFDNFNPPPSIDTPEACIRATDILSSNSSHMAILEYLLANVFICTQHDIIEGFAGQGTIIHQDGSAIRRKAEMKGGSVGLFQGKKLGRKKELEHLQKEVARLSKELIKIGQKKEKISSQLQSLKEKDKEVDLRQKETMFAQANEKYVTASTRLEGIMSNIARTKSTQEELKSEILVLTTENKKLEHQLVEKKAALDGLEGEIQNRGGEVDQWVGKISLASEAQNKANKELMLAENQEAALLQRIDFLNSQYQANEKLVKEGSLRLKDEEDEQRKLEKDLFDLEEQLNNEYKNKGEIQGALNEIEQKYYEERKGIVSKEEELRELNRRLRKHQEDLENNTQRYSEVRIELRSIVDRVEVEFGVTLKEIMDSGKEVEEGYEQLQEQVAKLRRRIELFGEINPMALEAYEEMKLRYDDIIQQKSDIEEAKSSLQATIKEIEEQATAQFFTAFEQVKIHFKEVFRTLFTAEDDCDLILTDPEDPLNASIEVVARPKGKRPRTLTQLSGGEKAMTAIALLFSLYLLKPAPFCIFDEVDAPFDDMNVGKFNAIMRKFSEQSQFIVITHNKLTMAKMDILYGIFMQERGVSNVSKVDFRSFKDELIFETN